jgi:FOG: WD40-like repeat
MNMGRKQMLLGFMITCLLASPAAVAGADWNMFHENAQHSGYMDQAADFTPTVWYFSTQGAIKSSPAILNKVAYFGSKDNHVYAVNLEDGTKLWDYKTDGAIISSPSISGDYIYRIN